MNRFVLIAIAMMVLAFSAIAQEASQDTNNAFEFNKDRFMAGSEVVQDKTGLDDLFIAGETIKSQQDITGSAHFVGRKVISKGAIGGDAYISGMDVTIDGKVSGDLNVGGYTIVISDVTGDLRATGDTVTLSGPVAGYAIVAGDEVNFNSVVTGDVSLAAKKIDFADDSRIEGRLIIYEEEVGKTVIPERVISKDRIDRRDASEWSEGTSVSGGIRSKLFKFFKRVLFLTVLGTLIASVRPQKLAELRRSVLGQPLRNLLFGFLGLALALGLAILLLFTGIGFALAATIVLLTLVGIFAGYVVGTYAIGVGLLQFANRPEPDTLGRRAFAALTGAVAIALVGMVPYLGLICILLVMILGTGALAVRIFQPNLLIAS